MRECEFSLTRILRYLPFCPYAGEHESVKTRVLTYFMQYSITFSVEHTFKKWDYFRLIGLIF